MRPPSIPTDQQPFLWCRMTNQRLADQLSEPVNSIINRKEAERSAGREFWWGMRTSLGENLRELAQQSCGKVPIVFSENPDGQVDEGGYLWTRYQEMDDEDKWESSLPDHVLVVGPKVEGSNPPKTYALVCASPVALTLVDQSLGLGEFETHPYGRGVAGSQSAAILRRRSIPRQGKVYRRGFSATLIAPWQVKLVKPRRLSQEEANWINNWQRNGGAWLELVRKIRGPC